MVNRLNGSPTFRDFKELLLGLQRLERNHFEGSAFDKALKTQENRKNNPL